MAASRFLSIGLIGGILSALSAATASAAVGFQNVQTYRWGYTSVNGTPVTGSEFSTWGGITYDQRTGSGPFAPPTDNHAYAIRQVGDATSSSGLGLLPTATMTTDGWLFGEWATNGPGTIIGQSSVSTRFTVNEFLRGDIAGEANARFINRYIQTNYFAGTMWTRVRLMDFVTGALVFSRIARVDSTDAHQYWQRNPFNTTVSLPAGRYNLVTDTYYEASPALTLTDYDQVMLGWDDQGPSYDQRKAWDVDLLIRRPYLWEPGGGILVPEPASASLLAMFAGALLARRTRGS